MFENKHHFLSCLRYYHHHHHQNFLTPEDVMNQDLPLNQIVMLLQNVPSQMTCTSYKKQLGEYSSIPSSLDTLSDQAFMFWWAVLLQLDPLLVIAPVSLLHSCLSCSIHSNTAQKACAATLSLPFFISLDAHACITSFNYIASYGVPCPRNICPALWIYESHYKTKNVILWFYFCMWS